VAGWFGVALIAVFLLARLSGIWHYNYFDFSIWHGHEMIFGYTVAVIAGFLLTAVRNWTGMDTPRNGALAGLVLLWLAPRLLQAIPAFPPFLMALADMLFLPVLAYVLARPIWQSKQRYNYPIPATLLLLAVANGMVHLEILEITDDSAYAGMHLGISLIVVLIGVIAGRILPFFIQRGLPGVHLRRRMWLEKLSMVSLYAFALVQLLAPQTLSAAGVTLAAAIIQGYRLNGWYHRRIWTQPMLWVLFLAYGWLVLGLALHVLSDLGVIAELQAVHALTAGAIGMFTMGMMARVALGHTGRVIQAIPGMSTAFGFMFAAAVLRVIFPLFLPDKSEWFVAVSGFLWVVAMLVFAVKYSPILLRARVDGMPG
jgi:uncharacterized protein involved in response to NO